MFWIVTGAPGSSKTLNMISMFKDVKDRPIYYHGIELTEEGRRTLNWIELTKDQAYERNEHVPVSYTTATMTTMHTVVISGVTGRCKKQKTERNSTE